LNSDVEMEVAALELEDGKVLVTGAGAGIGRAIALTCASAGAAVAVVDADGERAEAVATEVTQAGGSATALRADVAVWPEVQQVVADAVEALGGLTGVVNNAGILLEGPAGELAEDDWDRVLAVNLKAPWLCAKAALPHLQAGGGAIVNIASIAGLAAQPNHVAYSVSKAGVINLTRTLAIEYGRSGVRCNAICPGTIVTELMQSYLDGFPDPEAKRAELQDRNFAGRLGEPGDIAEAVVYLLSQRASYVNGATLVVDGGRTARVP
jgi:NAD(P)-dependent dehydrogenase (short-subunit alcohol dehydrogenase family)